MDFKGIEIEEIDDSQEANELENLLQLRKIKEFEDLKGIEEAEELNLGASGDNPARNPTFNPQLQDSERDESERISFSSDWHSGHPEILAPRVVSFSNDEVLDSGAKEVSAQDLREYTYREVVVDKNGMPRQAGADSQEGEFIVKFRQKAEGSLFLFLSGVLGRSFLTKNLHREVCRFIQKVPPFRKLVLMPREHAKTAIVSGGLPLHIIIQSKKRNIYFPGLEGSECRIMLAGENMKMAKKNLRVLEEIHSGNKVFRALWPHRCWENPRAQSKLWNAEALIFPRENEWPDPTIWAIGVDGAVTGSRPNVQIKDDLISMEARNSETVMQTAIEWHIASRALSDTYETESGLQSLEFIIGTRWAVFDLYSYIIDNDSSVEVIDERFHSIIRNGKILWPEKHTEKTIAQLQHEYKELFYLLYMNSSANPELTDFDLDLVREFKLIGGKLVFEPDERDLKLQEKAERFGNEIPKPAMKINRGTRLTKSLLEEMGGRKEYFRGRGF